MNYTIVVHLWMSFGNFEFHQNVGGSSPEVLEQGFREIYEKIGCSGYVEIWDEANKIFIHAGATFGR